MWDSPGFLDLPDRAVKPRTSGLTHVLDKGMSLPAMEALLSHAGQLVDVVKVGWGVAYIDPDLKQRVALCQSAGVLVSLGGTLLEIAESQGRIDQLAEWAQDVGVAAVEVSDGLQALPPGRKRELVRRLAERFVVLAETGAKDDQAPVVANDWVSQMAADLDAGARWVVVEGRESGTVGLYHRDGTLRAELVEAIERRLPVDKVIFEAPHKAQQAWLVRHFGADVNLGNVPPDEVLALETLRLGLRADTAVVQPAVASR